MDKEPLSHFSDRYVGFDGEILAASPMVLPFRIVIAAGSSTFVTGVMTRMLIERTTLTPFVPTPVARIRTVPVFLPLTSHFDLQWQYSSYRLTM
jgi:hypothetical protein